jgi:ATP-utilizing enzymes of the PP-loop superfamily
MQRFMSRWQSRPARVGCCSLVLDNFNKKEKTYYYYYYYDGDGHQCFPWSCTPQSSRPTSFSAAHISGSSSRCYSSRTNKEDQNEASTQMPSYASHHRPVKVSVTRTSCRNNDDDNSRFPASNVASLLKSNGGRDYDDGDSTALVDSLLSYTASLVNSSASNVIAFSGGVDSSLVAALVHRVFQSRSDKATGEVKAVLGVSNSLPQRQLLLARDIASFIGIDLVEVSTGEGSDETYIENNGQACFVCKSHLYSTLETVSQKAREISHQHDSNGQREVILYNGTNADDTKDPTRLGLVAARDFSVQSPLIHVTKDQVRRASKHLNLPNWNYAASPCLRSRLALGVQATEDHLRAVNLAEERVRRVLYLDETMNMRVRMLSGNKAMVELDRTWSSFFNKRLDCDDEIGNPGLKDAEEMLRNDGFEQYCKDLGFHGGLGGIRYFQSGSVSTKRPERDGYQVVV